MIRPDSPLKSIPKIIPKYLKALEKLGLFSVRDLLFYFPFRYDDFSKIVELGQNYLGENITVEGKIIKTKINRIFKRRMTVIEITLEDKNGTPLKAVWFNQPFILDSLKEGTIVRLSGKLELRGKYFSLSTPAWEKASRDATNTGRLVPIYSETAGISSKWIRWQIKPLLSLAREIPDPLPVEIRKKFNLYDIGTALHQIHFPDSKEKLIRAQKRFAFEEMFLVQLKAIQVKHHWDKNNSLKIPFEEKLIKDFVSRLPFKLTNAQRKASFEILKDLEKPKPMNRLLNGDVGSGKTVVAAIAALEATEAGYQVAIMAPTEILARQHFESFCKLFGNYNFNIALLTNSYKLLCHCERNAMKRSNPDDNMQHNLAINEIAAVVTLPRNDMIKKISSGKINIIIGTHALIQKDIKFKNLALVIIDEQHRFGVAQRAKLQSETMDMNDGEKKTIPHLLTMSATPIPRTLAIAFFGSLDLSVLDEMPKNRKSITTKIIMPAGRKEVYDFIRHEISSGRQVFVIFPLVEESKALAEVKAATEEYKKLQKIFPEFNIGLLHGRMKAGEKEKIMQEFSAKGGLLPAGRHGTLEGKDKKIQILVSTSVVEVGIDIPNATIMVIENAERFGLSQLHQFRGRVGRSEHQSYCFLFTENSSEKSASRLKTMEKTNDGFEISKADLELRGPGQFFGTLQSGLPDITMENLTNVKLIKFARAEAQNILRLDAKLKKHPLLADALKKFSQDIHLE